MRRLMQLIKSEAGRKIIYQGNINSITKASLEMFLVYALETLADDTSGMRPPEQVANAWNAGVRAIIKMVRFDKSEGRSSRFRWGASDVLSSWVNEEGPDEEELD